ncbi:sensor histidine kinase [Rubellicoccus peritrichatus]|uniref:Two-component regulator propeller domain-containing protein n=1 Tax=Rubellicoccus peritrichatus TaxID=3080537 RepID=A0AAQ3LC99_9BACT|nr:two-component regulator propeller domain-containing protein [Puniceicoccus sp. CR14]WOO40888.1 two-component regulator propeller domain-containing protein [Puniceicoccus sp. CR14]
MLLPVFIAKAKQFDIDQIPFVTPEEIGYDVTHWTVEDGLPLPIITSLTQTPDGILWIGSFGGLIRFDGLHFEVYDTDVIPELNGFKIHEILADHNNRLWIRSTNGKLTYYSDGKFKQLSQEDGLPSGGAAKLFLGSNGQVWLRGRKDNTFYYFDEDRITPAQNSHEIERMIDVIQVAEDTLNWGVLEEERAIVNLQQDEPVIQQIPVPYPEEKFTVGHFFRLPDGTTGATSNQGFYQYNGDNWTTYRNVPYPLSSGRGIYGATEDPKGTIWMGTYHLGVLASLPDGSIGRVRLADNEPTFVRSMIQDQEGNIWVGKEDGLYRIRPMSFTNLGADAGFEDPWIVSMSENADGDILMSTNFDIYRVDPESKFIKQIFANQDFLISRSIILNNDEIYYGTFDGRLGRLTPNGPEVIQQLGGAIHDLYQSTDDRLWVGSSTGLWVLHHDGSFKKVPIEDRSKRISIATISEDTKGNIYALSRDGIVFQGNDKNWSKISKPSDEQNWRLSTMHIDSEDTLWGILGHRGLVSLSNGKWSQYPGIIPSIPRTVHNMMHDDNKGLWLATPQGLFFLNTNDLKEYRNGERSLLTSLHFKERDGLGSTNCSSSSSSLLKTKDGRIWVGTQKGVSFADPVELEAKREYSLPANAFLDKIMIDDQPFDMGFEALQTGNPIIIPPGVHRLEIDYTAMQLTDPEATRFRYKMDGYDKEWIEAGTRRAAYYQRLSPGSYHFNLQAANQHGIWNPNVTSIPIVMQPLWWQRQSVRGGAFATAIALIGVLFYRRNRHIKEMQAAQHTFSQQLITSQEEERKRIAHELHDSLGQELLVLKGRLEIAGMKHPDAKPELEELTTKVSSTIELTRNLSHQLRPPHLERFGLSSSLAMIVQEVSAASHIPIKTEIDEIEERLPSEIEIALYRIAQEALTNMVKHSDAGEATLILKQSRYFVRLRISDDGRGFNPNDSKRKSGLGIVGMEERARLAGGIFRCASAPGLGTHIAVEIDRSQHVS